jgi:hydroxypyruvate reductase
MTKPLALLLARLPDFLTTPLSEVCDTELFPENEATGTPPKAEQIRAIVMGGGNTAPISLLDQLPNLEIISVYGVGYDGVPLDYCQKRGIRVTNTPDVLTDDVADIATALVLMTSRKLRIAEQFVRDRSWEKDVFPLTHSLKGKTAGILGLGRIGKAIADRLQAHGMDIAYYGRKPQTVPYAYHSTLQSLAEASDFLVVACPGGNETKHLVNAEVLTALGPEGTLINIARGSVVDGEAVVEALVESKIRGAGLDVFENEPYLPELLLNSDRVVLFPHIGSGTYETRNEMARLSVENVAAHFTGSPLLTPVI